jgi:hypothetical protein
VDSYYGSWGDLFWEIIDNGRNFGGNPNGSNCQSGLARVRISVERT